LEVFWNETGKYDTKVDIFVFGVTLSFSLTEHQSFLFQVEEIVASLEMFQNKIEGGLRLEKK
jgi:hypothetical protein